MGLADRAEWLKGKRPDLVADVMLYAIEEGGGRVPVLQARRIQESMIMSHRGLKEETLP